MEKEMATHSSILACTIPQREEPGRPVHGVTKSQQNWETEHSYKWENHTSWFALERDGLCHPWF